MNQPMHTAGRQDTATRQDTDREIHNMFGFVPAYYRAMPAAGARATWALHRDLELAHTSLDNKTKELIGLTMAAHLKCAHSIYFHTQTARMFGATDEEMREAILMGGATVAFSNSVAGAQMDLDGFKRDVDRCLANLSGKANSPQVARAQH